MTTTEEIQYLGQMLTATMEKDGGRLRAIGARLDVLADEILDGVQTQEAKCVPVSVRFCHDCARPFALGDEMVTYTFQEIDGTRTERVCVACRHARDLAPPPPPFRADDWVMRKDGKALASGLYRECVKSVESAGSSGPFREGGLVFVSGNWATNLDILTLAPPEPTPAELGDELEWPGEFRPVRDGDDVWLRQGHIHRRGMSVSDRPAYILRRKAKAKPGVERCEVYRDGGAVCFSWPRQEDGYNGGSRIEDAQHWDDFLAYEYSDGSKWSVPMLYRSAKQSPSGGHYMLWRMEDDDIPVRPVAVLFNKEGDQSCAKPMAEHGQSRGLTARLADDTLAALVASRCHRAKCDGARFCSTCQARRAGIEEYRRAVMAEDGG